VVTARMDGVPHGLGHRGSPFVAGAMTWRMQSTLWMSGGGRWPCQPRSARIMKKGGEPPKGLSTPKYR
jgi:hypothetical protein